MRPLLSGANKGKDEDGLGETTAHYPTPISTVPRQANAAVTCACTHLTSFAALAESFLLTFACTNIGLLPTIFGDLPQDERRLQAALEVHRGAWQMDVS